MSSLLTMVPTKQCAFGVMPSDLLCCCCHYMFASHELLLNEKLNLHVRYAIQRSLTALRFVHCFSNIRNSQIIVYVLIFVTNPTFFARSCHEFFLFHWHFFQTIADFVEYIWFWQKVFPYLFEETGVVLLTYFRSSNTASALHTITFLVSSCLSSKCMVSWIIHLMTVVIHDELSLFQLLPESSEIQR